MIDHLNYLIDIIYIIIEVNYIDIKRSNSSR